MSYTTIQLEMNFNEREMNALNLMAARTGRTVENLIKNYVAGWIGTLIPQAEASQVEEQINNLSEADKAEALALLEAKKGVV